VSTASFPSGKTENGAVNLTALISVDSQTSAALPVTIVPRSTLAQLVVAVNSQLKPAAFSVQLLGVLSAPSSCAIFIRNVTQAAPNRRLLSDSVFVNLYVISRLSSSEAQKYMDNLGVMWSSNPKLLQAIGIVGAAFESVIPIFSPPIASSPPTPAPGNSIALPDWFGPVIGVILSSICVGIVGFFAYKRFRPRGSSSTDKTTSQNSSTSSEQADVDGEEEARDEGQFVSIEIGEHSTSAAGAVLLDPAPAVESADAQPTMSPFAGLPKLTAHDAAPFSNAGDERSVGVHATPPKFRGSGVYARRKATPTSRVTTIAGPAIQLLYLGVALEEQCTCEWSGLRIPAVLCGMLNALATPVDVMCEALSAAAMDDAAAALVFAEVESRCVGRVGDADAVCGAIVSGRSVHGAGLDVGLLRLWLKRLPDAVSQREAAVVLTVAVVLFVLLVLSVDVIVFVCVQVVPAALRQQAVEAGRTKDKACIAAVGGLLPAGSQVKRCAVCCCFDVCPFLWFGF
jgi:hypothetical protein